MQIDHINIRATHDLLERVKDFYCGVFDLEVGIRPSFNKPGYWLYLKTEAIIHLTESDEHFENERQGYFDHVAFSVLDIKPIIKNLRSMGVVHRIDEKPEINMTQIFFKDPCGIGVEANLKSVV